MTAILTTPTVPRAFTKTADVFLRFLSWLGARAALRGSRGAGDGDSSVASRMVPRVQPPR